MDYISDEILIINMYDPDSAIMYDSSCVVCHNWGLHLLFWSIVYVLLELIIFRYGCA